MRQVVIASAVRTAVGSFGGTLKDLPAAQLGGIVIKEVLRRARVRSEKVDQVFMGNVLQAGQGQNPARQAAANAGISQYTPAVTVNVVCGSGLESIIMATQAIRAGDAGDHRGRGHGVHEQGALCADPDPLGPAHGPWPGPRYHGP